ncbi:hypothetical protein NEOLEDRAFT_570459 [Neolentinus lepideus HHB14362 ss-1]|uniref:Uncharacterized protein n=1 Tax=Neolentinus lepideus HHB14362 ss-1 TaxID=1314782 RepID=A0A165QZS1_9AGAM|nr:hypothetical protein NEOLEDRAFT_570459 [Neolentinus lepideus HHB14362 ss-1]
MTSQRTFPPTSSPKPNSTLPRTDQSFGGQMFTASCLIMFQSVLRCSLFVGCWAFETGSAVTCASFGGDLGCLFGCSGVFERGELGWYVLWKGDLGNRRLLPRLELTHCRRLGSNAE